jgi:drug/metabolite transporter (DMT)-like permease
VTFTNGDTSFPRASPGPVLDPHVDQHAPDVGRRRRGIGGAVRAWQPTPTTATVAIVGTSFAYASTTIFVRQLTDSGMSVIAVAFFRFALTALVLVRFVNLQPGKRRATRWGLCSGVVMGAGWIVYVRTISTADVAVAGVVQMTYPLFALVAGWLLFAAGPTMRALLSACLVVVAAMIGLGVGSGAAAGLSPLLFVAPASFGFSVSVLTERLGPLDPFERLASVAVGASLAMSPLLLTLSVGEVLPNSFESLGWVIAIGAISALVPMTIYAAAAPVIGSARSAAAGAFELPTVFFIGAVCFGESIRLGHLVAAAIIVGAIALTRSARSTHVVPDEDQPPRDGASPGEATLSPERS